MRARWSFTRKWIPNCSKMPISELDSIESLPPSRVFKACYGTWRVHKSPCESGKGNSFKSRSLGSHSRVTEIPMFHYGFISHRQTSAGLAFHTLWRIKNLKAPPLLIRTTHTNPEKGGCGHKTANYSEISAQEGNDASSFSIHYWWASLELQ